MEPTHHIVVETTWNVQGDDFRGYHLLAAFIRDVLQKHGSVAFRADLDNDLTAANTAYRLKREDDFFRAAGMVTQDKRDAFLDLVRRYKAAQECGGPDGFDDYVIHFRHSVRLADGPPPDPRALATSNQPKTPARKTP